MSTTGTPRAPGPGQDEKPDVDALVAELRAKVEERRRTGQYPPGLEEDLAAHFHRLLARRLEPARPVDLQGPLARVEEALPLRRDRIQLAGAGVVASGAALCRRTRRRGATPRPAGPDRVPRVPSPGSAGLHQPPDPQGRDLDLPVGRGASDGVGDTATK